MNIKTYNNADGISFGALPEFVKSQKGSPDRERTNNAGEIEFHYPQYIFRFDPIDTVFREITLVPMCQGKINGIDIAWDLSFFQTICQLDGSPKDNHGFIVCNTIGIAMTGFHDHNDSQLAITCYRRSDWDKFLPKAKPFRF